ncbi:hypothetical protein MBLNU457_3252t1 [Dothideomycetes sp. NU457]
MSSIGDEEGPSSPSTSDKKRSKLGYQRISLACTHCRKRKIRCTMAGDPEVENRTPEPGKPSKSGPGSKPQIRAPSTIDPLPHDSSDRGHNHVRTIPSNASDSPVKVESSIAGGPVSAAQLHSQDYPYNPGFVPPGTRPFPDPRAPYHEPSWRIPEAGTPEAFGHGQYPPPPVSSTSQYPGSAQYAFAQNPRDAQFAQPLRSNSAPWEVERAQQYPHMVGGPIPVSVASGPGQGIVYPAPYTQGDAQHQYPTSPAQYHPGAPGPYMPAYSGPQEHWHQYGPGAQFVGRHDSGYPGAWTSGMGPLSGMDPNQNVHPSGQEPYKRGSNHPG